MSHEESYSELDPYAPVTPLRKSLVLENLKQCREAALSKAEFTQEEYVPPLAKGISLGGAVFLELAVHSLLRGGVAELVSILFFCKVFYYNVFTLHCVRLSTPPDLQPIYQNDYYESENSEDEFLVKMAGVVDDNIEA